MTVGGMAGFALVFVVTVVTLSAVAALVLGGARRFLRKAGPMAERRAAEAAAIAPLVVGVIAVATLVVQSLLGVDHCEVHDHHAHLCLTHGAQWIERTWVVVVLAVAAATFVGRAAITSATYLRGARSINDLYKLSRAHGDVRLVDSDRAFCFVARRGVFVSSRVWSELPSGERDALIAHEHAHVHHGDLSKRVLLEGWLLFAAPLVGERIRVAWMRASERLCDARAASVTGDPEVVARAMVSMCRIGATQPAPGFAFTPTVDELAARIQTVLDGGPLGERAAVVLARFELAAFILFTVVAVAAAEPIHHAFETLLG